MFNGEEPESDRRSLKLRCRSSIVIREFVLIINPCGCGLCGCGFCGFCLGFGFTVSVNAVLWCGFGFQFGFCSPLNLYVRTKNDLWVMSRNDSDTTSKSQTMTQLGHSNLDDINMNKTVGDGERKACVPDLSFLADGNDDEGDGNGDN
ncbi:hypothetical protein LXL04_004315 [Taraxacum kok-saghyz]